MTYANKRCLTVFTDGGTRFSCMLHHTRWVDLNVLLKLGSAPSTVASMLYM